MTMKAARRNRLERLRALSSTLDAMHDETWRIYREITDARRARAAALKPIPRPPASPKH